MINKIKIIGKVTAKSSSRSPETESKGITIYFSIKVLTPSGVETILRCVIRGNLAERFNEEINEDDNLEVWGYLRNEKNGKQIIIKVTSFGKVDNNEKSTNEVRILGKIAEDLKISSNKEVISFKLEYPRKNIELPFFFLRGHGEIILEIPKELKKGDIVIFEGFLQSKLEQKKDQRQDNNKPSISSAIICLGFVRLDNDSVEEFIPLDKLSYTSKKAKTIDFSKPRPIIK